MKKLSKLIYFIFAFALITCMSIFNPAITFASAEEEDVTTSITISTAKINKIVDASAGGKLDIPMPDVSKSGVDKYVVVKDRSGNTYTYDCVNGTTKNQKDEDVAYFTAFNVDDEDVSLDTTTNKTVKYIRINNIGKGTYTIQYKVVDSNKTYYSDAQQVQVKGAAYEWQFNAENEEKDIIPSITNVGSTFVLPMPKLINNSDENADPIAYTVDDLIHPTSGEGYISITKGGVDVTNDVTTLDESNPEDVKVKYAFEEEGTYIIKYESKVSAFPNRTYTVKVDANYNSKAELKVTHNSFSNVQVGAETTFPTVNVTDKTHNKSSIEVNNIIKIKKGSDLVAELKPNQYTYTFENSGTYTVYYEATDAYGNTATSSAYSFTVTNKAPYLVTYAEDYTVTETDSDSDGENDTTTVGEVVTKADYLVKSEVGL
ncbi:MAG: hypothetical protein IJA72_05325, partial [Clostridia bacterium]|nr:hypothetical protein [Clostridia bacterium]